MRVAFVMYHVGINGKIELDTMERIDHCFQSIQKKCPESEVTLLTDEDTDCETLNPKIKIIRKRIPKNELMFQRLLFQHDYLKSHTSFGTIFFIDSDILLNKNPDIMFRQGNDLAFTFRNKKTMPINGGIIGVNGKNRDRCLRFFDEWIQIYKEYYPEDLNWWGDQSALAKIFNDIQWPASDIFMHTHNDLKIAFFPCKQYNYTPKNMGRLALKCADEAVWLHFKGNQKQWMKSYYRRMKTFLSVEFLLGLPILNSIHTFMHKRRKKKLIHGK